MYHISNDKRTLRSAELIWQGLEDCLEEKPLSAIRVVDINKKTYVSRATFYRLFDTVNDVIVYRCDEAYKAMIEKLTTKIITNWDDLFLFFVSEWLEQRTLVMALARNNLTSILYQTQMKNSMWIKNLFADEKAFSDVEKDYFVSILTGIIPALINTWYLRGQKESAEEICEMIKRSTAIITEAFEKYVMEYDEKI